MIQTTVPKLTWQECVTAMNWGSGQHVTLIGPTGRGKTELLIKLLDTRRWKIFLSTKTKDDTQKDMRGYYATSDPLLINSDISPSILFAPRKVQGLSAAQIKEYQGNAYRQVLTRLRDQGGWTIGLDEVRYLTSTLGLASELEVLWLQGRSEGLSLVANTQRPRHVPLEAYSQATHLFIWNTADDEDISRLADMVPGLDRNMVESALRTQNAHDALYVNTWSGAMFTTNTRG